VLAALLAAAGEGAHYSWAGAASPSLITLTVKTEEPGRQTKSVNKNDNEYLWEKTL
jgi:hypothetical protein